MDCSLVLWRGAGPGHRERQERESGAHMGTHNESTSAKPLAGKMRRADFREFLQPTKLKDCTFIPGEGPREGP